MVSMARALRHIEQQDLGIGLAANCEPFLVDNRGAVAGTQVCAVDGDRAACDLNPRFATGFRCVRDLVAGGERRRMEIGVLMHDD
jgi:hypothetical protein